MGLQLEEEEKDILSRQVRNFLLVTKEKRSLLLFFFKKHLLVWWQDNMKPYK